MSEFRARISRVRMKNGGADVRVLNRKSANGEEDWRGTIVANARTIAEQATTDAPLVGYVVVGLYADGASSVGFRYDLKRCPVPRTVIPAWIAEIIRRDMITAPEAAEVFDNKFEWVD